MWLRLVISNSFAYRPVGIVRPTLKRTAESLEVFWMTRILVTDDHPVVRCGVRMMLASEPDLIVMGEADSVAEMFQRLRESAYDLLILAISLPGRSGLDALRELRQLYPRLRVVMLTIHQSDECALRALRAGAAGYLTKTASAPEVIDALRRVLQGRRYVAPQMSERLAERLFDGEAPAPHEALSDREYEVMKKMAAGRGLNEIALELFLSPKTVSTYRSRLLQKLHLRTSSELMRYCFENGLAD